MYEKTLITNITLLLCIILFAAIVLTGCGKNDGDVAAPNDGGTAVESQTVEEDSFVTVPTPTRRCYALAGWDHDLTQPITKNMTVTAKWEVAPEMRDFNFTITANECTITGVRDKSKTSYVIPDM